MKKLRYFLESAALHGVAWLFPKLPRGVILGISNTIGDLAYLLDKRGRSTAHQNLRMAFGDEMTEQRRREVAKGSYRTFALTFLDLFWAPALTPGNWKQHVKLTFDGPADEAAAHEKGAIWVTPHYGNFEFICLACGYIDFKFLVVTEDFKNPPLTNIFRKLRAHTGHEVISNRSAMIRLIKFLKKQGNAAMLTDLTTPPSKNTAVIRCFGQLTCVTTMHVLVAERTGVVILPGLCAIQPDGSYHARLLDIVHRRPDETVPELTQRIWDGFESEIRKHPERWLWMYKHWRYRPTQEPRPDFPEYSRYSPKFEQFAKDQGIWPPDEGTKKPDAASTPGC